ncbi:MAG TPA: hypothetical protein VMI31_09840 [Fimbriimonadaceae bacterium]|nr:hypothetical protein [Fimbriimonadaceae bacterium]
MPEWLKGLDPRIAGGAGLLAVGAIALIVFRVARRIVQLGYFVLYAVLGFGIVYGASVYATHSLQVPLAMPIVGGLAFATAASFVRAKLMRIVGAVMLVALCALAGKFWTEYAGSNRQSDADNRALAAKGLDAAKADFADIARLLPKKDGKIASGWIPADALRQSGIAPEIKKRTETPAWHTWLTGLYDQEIQDLGLWTSGGTAEQAKKSLQLRPH